MSVYDLILKNGTIIDGTGGRPYVADIGIVNDRIVTIGDIPVTDDKVLDVTGKIVSSGFIDVHTHDDNAIIQSPDALPKVSQGVTTVIVGNCGISVAPLDLKQNPPEPLNLLGTKDDFNYPDFTSYVHKVNKVNSAVNVAALVGHSSLRLKHMTKLDRSATSTEVHAMKKELKKCLDEGALGLSTGLAYDTAIHAETSEVVELAKVAAGEGIYVTHLRSEFEEIITAIEEAFTIGKEADLPIVISHVKCAGPENWGRSKEVLKTIDKTCCDRVSMDCYPYVAGSSNLDLKQVDGKVKILITWSETHPEAGTRYLHELAQEWGLSQQKAAEKLLPAGAVYFSIHEDDMLRFLSHKRTMIGSDGLPHDPHPHPRLYGTFPRVLGKYAREDGLLSMPIAVRKMTGLPAKNFRLTDRGLLKEGYFADIVVFDEKTICDTATFEKPRSLASGIEHVFVNGVETYNKQGLTGQRNGQFIKRNNTKKLGVKK